MGSKPPIFERPEDLSVSRAEGQGLWAQADAARYGIHDIQHEQKQTAKIVAAISRDVAWIKVLVGVPSFIALVVLMRVVWILFPKSMEPLATLATMVVP